MEKNNSYYQKIYSQLFLSQREIEIFKMIGDNMEFLNSLPSIRKKMFEYLQNSAGIKGIIYTATIFDNPSNKYETICLKSFFNLLEGNKEGLLQFKEPMMGLNILESLAAPSQIIETVKEKNVIKFVDYFVDYSKDWLNSIAAERDFKDLKLIRNKIIAHSENVENTFKILFPKISEYNKIAVKIINVYSSLFQGVFHGETGIENFELYILNSIEFLRRQIKELKSAS